MTLLQSIVPNFGHATRVPSAPSAQTNEPRVKPTFTLHDDDNAFEAVVQLPGVAKEGLEITAQEGEITVVGRRAWTPPADWTTLYRESVDAPFELVLTHDNAIDAEKISAEIRDGVLRVSLPKAEASKPRKIAVN